MYDLPRGNCWRCKHPYSEENVFTHAGYKELFISGTCEACFDEVMGEEEPEMDVTEPKGNVVRFESPLNSMDLLSIQFSSSDNPENMVWEDEQD
jgi:hypothetical protein